MLYCADSLAKATGLKKGTPIMTKAEQRITDLNSEIMGLGPMLPGSISKQWNVCGTPGCKCKDPKHPIKHGPYNQLSFSIKGKSSSLFIKTEQLPEAERRIQRYKRFKELTPELIRAHVALAREQGLPNS